MLDGIYSKLDGMLPQAQQLPDQWFVSFYCANSQTLTEKKAHLQPLEQPLHEALLRSFCAHFWSELCHVLHDCWEERHRKHALPPSTVQLAPVSTQLCQVLSRAALFLLKLHPIRNALFSEWDFSWGVWHCLTVLGSVTPALAGSSLGFLPFNEVTMLTAQKTNTRFYCCCAGTEVQN